MTTTVRAAILRWSSDKAEAVARYLPRNYTLRHVGDHLLITGIDNAGWTLDGYVIPRLASGLYFAEEVTGRCLDCITHEGWATPDEGKRREPQDVCRSCFGSGVEQPTPAPLPEIDPVETLASIIAKATMGLCALAAEEEGNLRDRVLEIRDLSATLADLVERW